ncbi:hypothetical protein QOT17_015017 [Balamuthia mandrillaris]
MEMVELQTITMKESLTCRPFLDPQGQMVWLAKIIPLNQNGLLPSLPMLEKLAAWNNRAHTECAAHEFD